MISARPNLSICPGLMLTLLCVAGLGLAGLANVSASPRRPTSHGSGGAVSVTATHKIVKPAGTLVGFSADLVSQLDGQPQSPSQRYFQEGDKTRLESAGIVFITHLNRGIEWALMPASRSYTEHRMPSEQVRVKKDVETAIVGKLGASLVGTERVNGCDCVKYVKSLPGPRSRQIMWVSRRLNLAVRTRTERPSGSDTQEFRSIREGKQPASLFQIPKGYKKVESPTGR